ncbi:VOC family protein [Kaistia dalseonensis]|uniref:VOC family protein n=1 Tax=Kaistia dalseonensis TaxID=410840 RepID=UPI002259E6DF|nr:VOC family protein [Kaistia dalseonensis]MCX5494322.1 VOC family protein [Kaistia dalseonensis]
MFDHVGIAVSDYYASLGFYEKALAPLGIKLVMRMPAEIGQAGAGFGETLKPEFWIWEGGRTRPHVHIAFTAPDRATVDAFYAAAIAAGATDNGPPGVRAHYHANYYAAFVLDPDGHNIEAVCHQAA